MTDLDRRLMNTAVIGAGGKMGSGISLLLLQQIAQIELTHTGLLGSGKYRLELIDHSEEALTGLCRYLKDQLKRYSEQRIQFLRNLYRDDPNLISNQEIIEAYVEGALSIAKTSTAFSAAAQSSLIFEAVSEDVGVKVALFKHLESINDQSPYYFTNTSSIPINILADESNINGRIIGFHFYNPPAIQKLLEIIPPNTINPHFHHLVIELARRLNKIVVVSHDIAGFIGNGHFIREVIYSLERVEQLMETMPFSEAIAIVDRVTHDLLIRPMGIFQLIDYVGLDVVQHIVKIMANFLPDPDFKVPLLDQLLLKGIKGGQLSDGSQRNGIFTYVKGKPEMVYSPEHEKYQPFPELSAWMDPYPKGWNSWKVMQKEKELKRSLADYFRALKDSKTEGAVMGWEFLERSRSISEKLVADGVASSLEDVATVLKNGFFHLYAYYENDLSEIK